MKAPVKYQTKPVVVTAILFTGDNEDAVMRFCSQCTLSAAAPSGKKRLWIASSQGMQLTEGEYLVNDPRLGGWRVIPRSTFDAAYEKVK
jgi:hypothetical protein